eukprot:2109757-Amphidinium_carterae.1
MPLLLRWARHRGCLQLRARRGGAGASIEGIRESSCVVVRPNCGTLLVPLIVQSRWFGALMMKHATQIFVGGESVAKQMPGPLNFTAWRQCFRVYRGGDDSEKGSKAGPPDSYEDNVRGLSEEFPHRWDSILHADDIMRSDRCQNLRAEIEGIIP